ncbi:hypothetical protein [Streptomonospora salina]|uniref:Uncharacterized protein n=1 Tax=Streptomonospora salina TaxID=104205 RepID=A0A841ELA6_9ACTN|nr:hypothetical protein [Streptomonospora salina]MBB6000181.1 hypothetical protein [Streptomonospora salina]
MSQTTSRGAAVTDADPPATDTSALRGSHWSSSIQSHTGNRTTIIPPIGGADPMSGSGSSNRARA